MKYQCLLAKLQCTVSQNGKNESIKYYVVVTVMILQIKSSDIILIFNFAARCINALSVTLLIEIYIEVT